MCAPDCETMTPSTASPWNRPLSLLAVPAIVALDLNAKAWARGTLIEGVPIEITSFFNLALGFNRGVAFGLMNGIGVVFVACVTIVITLVFGFWWWRETKAFARFGLAMILGGALANLADRLQRGEVTDFLDVYAAGFHWPTFNLADAALTLGVVILLVASARRPSHVRDMSESEA